MKTEKENTSSIKFFSSLLVGQGDQVTPPATNAQRYAKLIRGARLTVFPGNVGHMTFSSECTPLGKKPLKDAKTAKESTVRRSIVASNSLRMNFFSKCSQRNNLTSGQTATRKELGRSCAEKTNDAIP